MDIYKLTYLLLIFVTVNNPVFNQSNCDKFQILSLYDIPPTPQTPEGNYFFLLLTIKEDAPDLSAFYADLYFVNNQNDTITNRLGLSQTLPVLTTDTIPYLMKLSGQQNNLDFPLNFEGKLVIEMIDQKICEIPYTNIAVNTHEHFEPQSSIKVYPNPFADELNIESKYKIENINIIDIQGYFLKSINTEATVFQINARSFKIGTYFFLIKLDNGIQHTKMVVKSQ
jgi:hypothetical protein